MSKEPIDHATLKIKRTRAPVRPFAIRSLCEHVIKLLGEDELVRELSPPEEWRIHPLTKARGKGFQHERRLWVKNNLSVWHIAKMRKHAQNPTKSARRSSFEGGFVSQINSSFAELLRRIIRGGGGNTTSGDGKGVPGHAKGFSPQLGPKGESPHVAQGARSGSTEKESASRRSPEPQEGVKEKQGKEVAEVL